jgi:hypothetical protein
VAQDFEKLGAFYLGREYDVAARAPREALVLYDSRDLVTHAAIIGMTGSGKTGLAIDLLEEAGIDGVPAIAIDPKGDLGSLLLGFPGLSAAEFLPWINKDEAARKGLAPGAFAEQQAKAWRDGLAAWGQDGDRIRRFREAVDLAIYTPGSTAGLPLSILRSFDAPPAAILEDGELFAGRVSTSVSGLLSLVGVEADPVRSREHILLSTILSAAWKQGENVPLDELIVRIQKPPVARVGVLDIESFYPSKDRFDLAMRLNGLLAAPGFEAWLEGDPLDVDRLLHTPSGKPRISIVSIAHLGDTERMFFVSLLLNEVLGWMRRQAGTTSLRALIYMDEVAGYLPPVANPPSKIGFMTLLKQARAFGLGTVLATQNPADLDYKALSNIGTWIVGRLQTERDKSKVLEGLEGALASGGRFDRSETERLIGSLGKRVFLMNNVHDDAPVTFESRWALSYLSGPLTRDQIKTLMADRTAQAATAAPGHAGAGLTRQAGATGAPSKGADAPSPGAPTGSTARPVLPPDVPVGFVPKRGAAQPAVYEPRVFASAQVQFIDAKLGINEVREVAVTAPFVDAPVAVDFARAEASDVSLTDLESEGEPGAVFGDVPPAATRAKNYDAWSREFARWLYQTQTLDLQRDPATGLSSKPGESERDFRIRLQVAQREQRDAAKQALQQRYAPKLAMLQERLRRAEERKTREADQASARKMETALSVGASMLGALFGRKTLSATNIGRMTSAARSASRTLKESKDVALAEEGVEAVQQRIEALDAELRAEIAGIDAQPDASIAPLEPVSIKPKKTQVAVQKALLAWVPQARD